MTCAMLPDFFTPLLDRAGRVPAFGCAAPVSLTDSMRLSSSLALATVPLL